MNFIPIIVMNSILLVITVLLVIAEKFLVSYGECKIIINKEKILPVQGGGTLLNYFTENKIFIPSACGAKATCGHCKVKVLTGGGSILPTEEIFISRDERMQGLRLACQVKVRNDIEIYMPEHLLSAKEYSGIVEKIYDLTHDIKFVKMKIQYSEVINFKPGQYIQFKVPGTEEFRAYSIASSPEWNDTLEFTIRLVPGGLCSTYVHHAMEVGDKLALTGPFGDFYLKEDSDKEIICIGGGCGMAPIMSILYHLKKQDFPRKVVYFFGARSKRDLFYTDELEELGKQYSNFKYIPALSEPKATDKWAGETGFITQVVEKHIESIENAEAYLCGPPPMIDASLKVLTKKGIKQENILYDKF